jgi:cationic amino acid transporter 3
MFPMPRVVYSMASDGLLFEFLAYLVPKLKTPVFASVVTGLLAGLLVLIFDLNQLIDMMSIGTLLAYSLVSTSTLVLRYKPFGSELNVAEPQQHQLATRRTVLSYIFGKSDEPLLKRLFWPASTKANKETSHLVNVITMLTVFFIVILCCLLNQSSINEASYAFIVIFLIVIIVFTFIIWIQPQSAEITTFKVPFVPFFPLLSTFVNLFLMISLNAATWIRFGIWLFFGLIMYFGYGIRNSKENVKGSHQNRFFPCIEKSYGTMTDEMDNESNL